MTGLYAHGVGVCVCVSPHTQRPALMTIVSGPCRGRSSRRPPINPIDLSQGSKVTGVLIGESALRSKARPDSRQINDASVMCIICVFIYPVSNRILAFYYPACLCVKNQCGGSSGLPRNRAHFLTRCRPFQCRWCSGQVH